MDLQQPPGAVHRRPAAEIGHGQRLAAVLQTCTHRPHPVRWHLDSLHRQVGRRKPQGPPQFCPLNHFGSNRIRPAQHPRGLIKVAVVNRLPDPGAADPVALEHHRRHRLKPIAPRLGFPCQKRHIAHPPAAKPPILPYRDGFHRCRRQTIEKIAGRHRRHRRIKPQGNENPDAKASHNPALVVQCRQ